MSEFKLFRLGTLLKLFASLVVLASTSAAQQDAKGSKDHPLLSRYPNSHIGTYEKNYNEVEFPIGTNGEKELVEGNTTKIMYFHNSAEDQPSPLQVLRNYQNAAKAIGGEVVYEKKPEGTGSGLTTLKVTTAGKEFWVLVAPEIYSAPTQSYTLTFVERAAMEQVVTANKLLDELNKQGFVRLYINFDTDKWTIKPDSFATLDEVSKMLKGSPSTKISIEGHTDNTGSPEHNMTLSNNRAASVLDALTTRGVDAERLSSKGLGQDKPIADNSTEDGRAKNRRVELVKQS